MFDMAKELLQSAQIPQDSDKPKVSQKEYIQGKMDEYTNTFTVHGLTRSIKTKRTESIFWSTILLIGILCSSMVIHGLVTKFRKRAVYTEIRFQITDRNYFPGVTFCEKQLLVDSNFAYCGVPPRFSKMKLVNETLPCTYDNNRKLANTKHVEDRYWATEVFNVTRCSTWSGKICNNNYYLKTLTRTNNSCFAWNYRGDFFDMYSKVDIHIKFKRPSDFQSTPNVFAILHDSKVQEIDITRKIDMSPSKHYQIKIDKTVIKRLPAPFPTKCANHKMNDIYPGKYSRYGCIESHNSIAMYKECGDIFDYSRKYIPLDIKEKYKRNVTILELLRCVRKFTRRKLNTSDCQLPCEDVELNYVLYVHNVGKESCTTEYKLSIQLQRVDAYKIMEEKELYTGYQMACDVGGFIGLVMGMSLVSIGGSPYLYISINLQNDLRNN